MPLRHDNIKDMINQRKSSRSAAEPDEMIQEKDDLRDFLKTITDVLPLREMEKLPVLERQKISLENTAVDEKHYLRKVYSGSYSSKQLATVDPDERFKNNPAMVSEYIPDIFNYLRSLEKNFPIQKGFLESHKTTPMMRSKLVNWLVKVHMLFGFYTETLHLCVAIVDRYLQKNKNLGNSKLQLVGISALLIASKYEETFPLKLTDYEYPYSKERILKMELHILNELDFCLGRPLSILFLRRFNKIAQSQRDHRHLGSYMLELALSAHELSHVRPSLQAAAVCCLSIGILNDVIELSTLWTPTLVQFTNYKYSDLKGILVMLAVNLLVSRSSKFDMIRRKYAKSTYAKISLNSKLYGPLVQKLATKCGNYDQRVLDPLESGFLTSMKDYFKKCLCISTSRKRV